MLKFVPKLICFDLNKTLIEENTWLELNLAVGVTLEEDTKFMQLYEEGKITYEQGQEMLSEIYRSRGLATREYMFKSINKYNYLPGAKQVVKYLQRRGYKLCLISGSIDLLVEKVGQEMGISMYGANNRFIFNENDYFEKMIYDGDDSDFKLSLLRKFCKNLKIDVEEVVCIGDGANDAKVFKETKHGITFKGSKIENLAWKTVEKLEDIKKIL